MVKMSVRNILSVVYLTSNDTSSSWITKTESEKCKCRLLWFESFNWVVLICGRRWPIWAQMIQLWFFFLNCVLWLQLLDFSHTIFLCNEINMVESTAFVQIRFWFSLFIKLKRYFVLYWQHWTTSWLFSYLR